MDSKGFHFVWFILFLLMKIFFCENVYSQDINDTTTQIGIAEKRVSIFPMPLISANPTAGFLFGLAPAFNFHTANPETTSMSTAIFVALITTKNQFFTSIRSNAFLKEDQWAIMLDTRFNINNQPTFGLGSKIEILPGETAPREERIYFDMFRFYGTALKKHRDSRFFYGLGYLFDVIYNIVDEDLDFTGPIPKNTFHQEYHSRKKIDPEKYYQSGFSLNTMWDSRDNVANPYTGKFALASLRVFPQLLGSIRSTSQLWLEHRNYFNLDQNRPRHLLALWTYGWFTTSGDVPYMFLPALGWDMFNRSGRPYTFGRFRGENLVYGELEWRFPLLAQKDWLGGVVFLNSTSASNRFEKIPLFEYTQFGYGLGLRFKVIPKKRVNLGIDYGWGTKGARGYFLNLNEVF